MPFFYFLDVGPDRTSGLTQSCFQASAIRFSCNWGVFWDRNKVAYQRRGQAAILRSPDHVFGRGIAIWDNNNNKGYYKVAPLSAARLNQQSRPRIDKTRGWEEGWDLERYLNQSVIRDVLCAVLCTDVVLIENVENRQHCSTTCRRRQRLHRQICDNSSCQSVCG